MLAKEQICLETRKYFSKYADMILRKFQGFFTAYPGSYESIHIHDLQSATISILYEKHPLSVVRRMYQCSIVSQHVSTKKANVIGKW